MKQLKVLSLFDGMSCGQLAISQLGFNYEYYASEIDKHAIAVTMSNFPDTIQLGSVEHWQLWDIDFASIDVIIGGSPCQGFSFAGKQLNFEDPRSKLFFVYVDVLNYIRSVNPNVKFLLENVKMKKEYEAVISEQLGVQPIEINSNLVSAQNRKRLYWTNIRGVTQPEDRGVYLKDVLQEGVDEKYYLSGKSRAYLNRAEMNQRYIQSAESEKSKCVVANYCKGVPYNVLIVPEATKKGYAEILPGEGFDHEQPNSKTRRGRRMSDKSNSLMAQNMSFLRFTETCKIRRLTPIECERLQTVPDNYTASASDTQRYRMLGNGWTVEVIKLTLKNLNV